MDNQSAQGRLVKLVLDFETYWDTKAGYSLKSKGISTTSYVLDKRFHAHGCAVKFEAGDSVWVTHDRLKPLFARVPWERTCVIMHNATFDACILKWIYGISPFLIIDTLGMSRAVLGNALPRHSLDTVSKYYGLEGKHNVSGFNNTNGIERLSEQEEKDLIPYALNDADITWDIYQRLAKEFPKKQYRALDWTIRMASEPQLHLDVDILDAAHKAEIARREKVVDDLGVKLSDLRSNPKFAALLEKALTDCDAEETVPTKISSRTGLEAFAFSKSDEEFTDLLEHEDETVRSLVESRLAVKGSLAETRALSYKNIALVTGGLAPVGLNFSGAVTTHRLSGNNSHLGNVQNLSRGSQLRRAIVAPKGYKIYALDLSQIELRTGALLVGQMDLVHTLATGGDPYSDFAAHVYQRIINKKDDPEERQVGKVAVLSCQYYVGGKSFRRMLMMQARMKVDIVFATMVVNTYREIFNMYPVAWADLTKVLEIWSRGREWEGDFPLNLPSSFEVTRGRIIMPSGLSLKYPDVRKEWVKGKFDDKPRQSFTFASQNKLKSFVNSEGERRQTFYSGLWFENINQSAAACVIGHVQDTVRRETGHHAAMQVHDELVWCIPDSEVEAFGEFAMDVAHSRLNWWPDLVVAAEGGYHDNYLDLKKQPLRRAA